MQELKELTESVQKKSSELIRLYKHSVQENISLKSKNKELRYKVETLETKVKEQSEQIVKLQMLKFLGEESHHKEAKLKLNELVRELDRCLQLLKD